MGAEDAWTGATSWTLQVVEAAGGIADVRPALLVLPKRGAVRADKARTVFRLGCPVCLSCASLAAVAAAGAVAEQRWLRQRCALVVLDWYCKALRRWTVRDMASWQQKDAADLSGRRSWARRGAPSRWADPVFVCAGL